MKIPFIKAIINPFGIIGDNIKDFFKISSAYALVLTIIGYFLGTTYACLYPSKEGAFFFCSNFGVGFYMYQVIKLAIFASFIKNWNNLAFEKTKLELKPNKKDGKVFLALVAIVFIFILPMISAYFLYKRVPNPNYQIEVVYFAVASIGIWLPFLFIRLLPIIGFLASDTMPNIKEVWHKTKDSAFRIISFLLIIAILFLFVFSNFAGSFASIQQNYTIANVIFTDFVYNITMLLILAIFANHCIITASFIKGEK